MSPPPPPSNSPLGPPLIQNSNASAAEKPTDPTNGGAVDEKIINPEPAAVLHPSTGNACVDFFFQVLPDTPPPTVASLLTSAWRQDPLAALKLVGNLRAVRGTGKNDKESFYACALWIHDHHPKTLALNVAALAGFGYMKDLLEILYRLLNGPDARNAARSAPKPNFLKRARKMKRAAEKKKHENTINHLILVEFKKLNVVEPKKNRKRLEKKAELATRAVEAYSSDLRYQFLYDRVAEFFAGMLASDVEHLKSGDLGKIGLAAKWCPSPDSSFDKSTLLCEGIARVMFPKESDPEYKDIEEAHYAYRIRSRLRREVLVPLRKALELPEIYMSACKWDSLPYERVASLAMKKYAKIFKAHDGSSSKFDGYLKLAKEGQAKMAAGALLPHEIVGLAGDKEKGEIAELQWKRLVDDMAGRDGRLKNCIAVCNVSLSMLGRPMEVCTALGLLISELSEEPWKGRVITNGETPKLHKIKGESLREKAKFVRAVEWGEAGDLMKVFDRMLEIAVAAKVEKGQMIRRVFVFSDTEEESGGREGRWEAEYEGMRGKYEGAGYEMPEIVLWNLKGSSGPMPVRSGRKGVALVSGFSKNLLRIFVERDGELSPESIMEAAISGEEYQKLEVFD